MKNVLFVTLLFSMLTACAPAQTNSTDAQNIAIAAAWTETSRTSIAPPTVQPPTFTPTATLVFPTSSPIPT